MSSVTYLNTGGVAKLNASRFSLHSGCLSLNNTASTEATPAPRECPVSTILYSCMVHQFYDNIQLPIILSCPRLSILKGEHVLLLLLLLLLLQAGGLALLAPCCTRSVYSIM